MNTHHYTAAIPQIHKNGTLMMGIYYEGTLAVDIHKNRIFIRQSLMMMVMMMMMLMMDSQGIYMFAIHHEEDLILGTTRKDFFVVGPQKKDVLVMGIYNKGTLIVVIHNNRTLLNKIHQYTRWTAKESIHMGRRSFQ